MAEADSIFQPQMLNLQDESNAKSHRALNQVACARSKSQSEICRDAVHVILVVFVVEWPVRGRRRMGWN